MNEEWRHIVKAPEGWEASSEGRLRNGEKIIEPKTKGGHGYFRDYIPGFGTCYRHRLVLEAFKEQPLGKNFCNHINGNKHDNRISNLEWSTNRENLLLAGKKGKLRPKHRITPVRVQFPDGTEKIYPSQAECSRDTGVSDSCIAKALTGDRATTHGMRIWYMDAANYEPHQMDLFEFMSSEKEAG